MSKSLHRNRIVLNGRYNSTDVRKDASISSDDSKQRGKRRLYSPLWKPSEMDVMEGEPLFTKRLNLDVCSQLNGTWVGPREEITVVGISGKDVKDGTTDDPVIMISGIVTCSSKTRDISAGSLVETHLPNDDVGGDRITVGYREYTYYEDRIPEDILLRILDCMDLPRESLMDDSVRYTLVRFAGSVVKSFFDAYANTVGIAMSDADPGEKFDMMVHPCGAARIEPARIPVFVSEETHLLFETLKQFRAWGWDDRVLKQCLFHSSDTFTREINEFVYGYVNPYTFVFGLIDVSYKGKNMPVARFYNIYKDRNRDLVDLLRRYAAFSESPKSLAEWLLVCLRIGKSPDPAWESKVKEYASFYSVSAPVSDDSFPDPLKTWDGNTSKLQRARRMSISPEFNHKS